MNELKFPSLEHRRLKESPTPWKAWGPYLSERQWGTVREDYSPDGNAWKYTTHASSISYAYRWGEDGIGGICDSNQTLCFAPAFWNHADPIIKERFFGLDNQQGNHGEDVKECYYYLDNTPTHSYMKMLYKYPQREFPYRQLEKENKERTKVLSEYELADTRIFDDSRYFDVFVEYAKASPADILIRITALNRGSDIANLDIIPQLWFRNTWAWTQNAKIPTITKYQDQILEASSIGGEKWYLHWEGSPTVLFCRNETNISRLYGAQPPGTVFAKDFINEAVVHGMQEQFPGEGTKCALHYKFTVPASQSVQVILCLSNFPQPQFASDHATIFANAQRDADEFYAAVQGDLKDDELKLIDRQASAGLLWSKQWYYFDVAAWLRGDSAQPPPPHDRRTGRNADWLHVDNHDIISMPDKWEYPWYAAWDLGFHCVALCHLDPEFAKQQLLLLTRERYMHPNGQLPAYEWEFSNVNPPVQAWATWRVYKIDKKLAGGTGDLLFLERMFHKLLLNFTWWVNRKDFEGRNLFQGGFLGLDNIGVFNRNEQLPQGYRVDQADATSWMAMYCLNLMRIALELSQYNPAYQDLANKFFEHFLGIASAMTNMANQGVGLWDDADEFYYDLLSSPNGERVPLRIRSVVGLVPLFAVEILEPSIFEKFPVFTRRMNWFLDHRPEMAALVSRWYECGRGDRHLLSLLRGHRMKCLLRRMLDESEFLSPFGVRSLSKFHKDKPFILECGCGDVAKVSYLPGESDSWMFGGNSNWRGPIWFPINYLIIESLQKFHHYYGDDFKVECPTGSGNYVTILDVAEELTRRLTSLFIKDDKGRLPIYRGATYEDPEFTKYPLFYEYFDGDSGRGLGASHQTGWTGLISKMLRPRKNQTRGQTQFLQQCKNY